MARLPYQVLVFPFRRDQDDAIKYAVFERAYGGGWGGITGGGEEDESPLEAAERQASEKAAIPLESEFLALASFATVPVEAVAGFLPWGPEILVMPEYAFAVEVGPNTRVRAFRGALGVSVARLRPGAATAGL